MGWKSAETANAIENKEKKDFTGLDGMFHELGAADFFAQDCKFAEMSSEDMAT